MHRTPTSLPAFILASLLFWVPSPSHAAPFSNLNFEQAAVSGYQPPRVPTTNALPSWTAAFDGNAQSQVWANQVALDATCITLMNNLELVKPFYPCNPPPIQGHNSVVLYGCAPGVNPPGWPHVATLSQTGDFPADAKTIQFYVCDPFGYSQPDWMKPILLVNDRMIDLYRISTSNKVTLMAGDISPFASGTGQLTFMADGAGMRQWEDVYELDSISFSRQTLADLGVAVPEPTSAILIFPALCLLLRKRRFNGAGIYGFFLSPGCTQPMDVHFVCNAEDVPPTWSPPRMDETRHAIAPPAPQGRIKFPG